MRSSGKDDTVWTVIIQMQDKGYHVAETCDPEGYVRERRDGGAGFFSQKRNQGKTVIVFAVEGRYAAKIRSFGCRHFIRLMRDHSRIVQNMMRLNTAYID